MGMPLSSIRRMLHHGMGRNLRLSSDPTAPGGSMSSCLAFIRHTVVRFPRWAALALGVVACAPAFAQYQIGEYRLAREARASSYLQVGPAGSAGLRSMSFVGRVGGANFEAAISLKQHPVGSVDLTYDASRPDGARVTLTLGSTRTTLPLWDWQARPIAEFADSQYTAAVSLFGEGPSRDKFFYIDYHPAFFDRLLGLRLLQADIMLIDPSELRKPPRPDSTNGLLPPVTATGEPVFDDGKSRQAAVEIAALMKGQQIGSWVLTDVDSDVTPSVAVHQGRIIFSLRPYYYFWRPKETDPTPAQKARARSLIAEFQMAHSRGDMESTKKAALGLRALEESLTHVERVDGLTNALRVRPELVRDLNPQVHDAVYKTALYAALFRGVKQHSPVVWRKFVDATAKVAVPVVQVPNEWKKSERLKGTR
jgi:hypothetical protein